MAPTDRELSLDLTAASTLHLLEPQWNPALEDQALARVHRLGQTRPVTTIRYVMQDSFEEVCILRTLASCHQMLRQALTCLSTAHPQSPRSQETTRQHTIVRPLFSRERRVTKRASGVQGRTIDTCQDVAYKSRELRLWRIMSTGVLGNVSQSCTVRGGRSLPAPTSDVAVISASQLMPEAMRNQVTAT
ncbi:hypothetical protein IG631_07764 [Alternaria alternata]|nr:hypothetical protein IG631_07764 [Alternaria alternata]